MKHILTTALTVGITASLCACSREHMSDNYARQSREFFARQHVYSQAAEGSPKGLDSEESALIQTSYRKSLGEEQTSSKPNTSSSVLLLEDSADAPGAR